ncbi:MAG: DUF1643 domain-containing protein [Desulfobulbaceae bacterium]|nr:MAG: DUF1643 domain-containing protein [Desulfobulbaceae bacterium]
MVGQKQHHLSDKSQSEKPLIYNIYESSPDNSARFLLGKKGSPSIMVIGLNPSIADQQTSDITASKIERIAALNGYKGFVIANLYPLRSTQPDNLPHSADMGLIEDNVKRIRQFCEEQGYNQFWAAWGTNIVKRDYLQDSFLRLDELVKNLQGRWISYGALLKFGHPRHPSRASYSSGFNNFCSLTYSSQLPGLKK